MTEIVFDPHFQRRQTLSRLASAAGYNVAGFYGHRLAYTLHLVKP